MGELAMAEHKLYPISDASLKDAQDGVIDISQIWWDGRLKVGMMADKHLDNALNKLMGLGLSEYEDKELTNRWIQILSMEKLKRLRLRKASKVDSQTN